VTPFSILLVLISTFLHAGWNLLARRERKEHAFILRMLAALCVIAAVPAALGFLSIGSLPARALWCALLSGAFCGLYYLGLARAYASGEFSVVYPVARALPVLLIGCADIVRGRVPTLPGWAGLLMVTAACAVIPIPSLGRISLRHYFNRTNGWALLAALMTVGYTITDKYAAEAVHDSVAYALVYGYLFFLVATVAFALCLRQLGGAEADARQVGWRLPALAGAFCFGAYSMVLWAYQLAEKASYVVAFRQVSILIGVVIAALLFKERVSPLRIVAACAMVLGLIVIALFG